MPRLAGVIAAAATPLRDDLTIDLDRLVEHCRWLLGAGGCDGINLLGTTGEATSLSLDERLAAMRAVERAGLPMDRFLVGTGAAALADACALTAAAKELGFAGALLLPPFYYKGVDAAGLEAFIDAVIDRVGREGLKLYLYHFPQNSGVPYPTAVVEQLQRRYPEQVLGLKDSSGDLAYAGELARRMPGFDVFPSSEGALARASELGLAGCISATANITGPFARAGWQAPDSEQGQAAIRAAVRMRDALARFPLIAAVKAALADLGGGDAWSRLLPPLTPLAPRDRHALRASLAGTPYAALPRIPCWS